MSVAGVTTTFFDWQRARSVVIPLAIGATAVAVQWVAIGALGLLGIALTPGILGTCGVIPILFFAAITNSYDDQEKYLLDLQNRMKPFPNRAAEERMERVAKEWDFAGKKYLFAYVALHVSSAPFFVTTLLCPIITPALIGASLVSNFTAAAIGGYVGLVMEKEYREAAQ